MVEPTSSGHIVIAGGSGFLGGSLALHLMASGASVAILSRSAPKVSGPWRHAAWDARTVGDWRRELEGATGLVNLVGRSVDCVKTPDHQDEILRSRVEATRALGEAIRSVDSPPPVWVQMSTAHIYGDRLKKYAPKALRSAAASLHSLAEPGRKHSPIVFYRPNDR